MRNLLLIAIAVTSQAVVAAGGIYSWTDESGNLMYGDNPPDNVAATAINPPKLTVLEGFSSRYSSNSVVKVPESTKAAKTEAPEEKDIYSEVKVIAPKNGQAIRANDGDVSVALGLAPKLRAGDQIVVTLNGQELSRGTSRVVNLSNLDRGEHQLVVSILNQAGNTLIASEAISFSVLRNSVLINKPYSPYPKDASAT